MQEQNQRQQQPSRTAATSRFHHHLPLSRHRRRTSHSTRVPQPPRRPTIASIFSRRTHLHLFVTPPRHRAASVFPATFTKLQQPLFQPWQPRATPPARPAQLRQPPPAATLVSALLQIVKEEKKTQQCRHCSVTTASRHARRRRSRSSRRQPRSQGEECESETLILERESALPRVSI
ncbi:hypothetical protein DEO72_LG5g1608 [Vigna unguiculata]|uniref:Uncharacterized protein n=1 Tax=Vigna unguiculata TaxID=3917 RepID=A0A4D6LYG0_VIGUN|nr:hypothetical protein DEO72_LG5g1608 [Vigna unguiculata]